MLVSKPEPPVGAQRGWVARIQHIVPFPIDSLCFFFGKSAPKKEHHLFASFRDLLDHCIGEGFPTLVLVTSGLVGPYGQRCVEQQYALSGPTLKIAAFRIGSPHVRLHLLEDVYK